VAALPAWVGLGVAAGASALILSDVFRSTPLPAAARRRTAWLTGLTTTGFLLVLIGSITLLGPGVGAGLALLIALGRAAGRPHPRRRGPVAGPPDRAGRPPSPSIGDTATADLCRVWQQSWFTMSDLPPGPLRDQVVELRCRVLDELERRHPDGVRRWLQSGPRADGDPSTFLSPGPGAP
jgi:hypothetical protein